MKEEMLKGVYPKSSEANRAKFAPLLEMAMSLYDINTVNRKRAFLAQVGHESGQLSVLVENLSYSAKNLRTVFGKYFKTDAEAKKYAHKPQAIANIVYANRLGNGDTKSGDGWYYRGRGLIQITGKDNYRKANKGMRPFIDLLITPGLLETPKYAALSAAWWWSSNGLNELADKLGGNDDAEVFKKITKRINGGYNGLADRMAIYERTKKIIII